MPYTPQQVLAQLQQKQSAPTLSCVCNAGPLIQQRYGPQAYAAACTIVIVGFGTTVSISRCAFYDACRYRIIRYIGKLLVGERLTAQRFRLIALRPALSLHPGWLGIVLRYKLRTA